MGLSIAPLSTDARQSLASLRDRDLNQEDFFNNLIEVGFELYQTCALSFLPRGEKEYFAVVMRAGMGLWMAAKLVNGQAETGFIDVKRDEETLLPTLGMYKCRGDLSEHTVIVFETMLATGGSLSAAICELKKRSKPKRIIAITLLSVPVGIKRMVDEHPDVEIITAAVDEGLNECGYIVPGLGDAGDRQFGPLE